MRSFLLLSAIAMFLPACQTQPPTLSYDEQLMWAHPVVEANVSVWRPPQKLLHLPFVGEVVSTKREHRILYYDDDNGTTITIRVRPLPAGWEDMSERRAVNSHLLEQHQYYAQQAHLNGALNIDTYAEDLNTIGLHGAAVSTVAYAEQHPTEVWHNRLAATIWHPVFISLQLRYPRHLEYTDNHLHRALNLFLEHNEYLWYTPNREAF